MTSCRKPHQLPLQARSMPCRKIVLLLPNRQFQNHTQKTIGFVQVWAVQAAARSGSYACNRLVEGLQSLSNVDSRPCFVIEGASATTVYCCMQEPIIRIAQVVTVKQHPKADRLKLCTVDSGSSTVQVCPCWKGPCSLAVSLVVSWHIQLALLLLEAALT